MFDSRIEVVILQTVSPGCFFAGTSHCKAASSRKSESDMGGVSDPPQRNLLTRGLGSPNCPRSNVLQVVKRWHSGCVVLEHCESMRLRSEEMGPWPCETKWGAHARASVHLQFQEIPPSPLQLPAYGIRQSFHSFIPFANIALIGWATTSRLLIPVTHSQHLPRALSSIGALRRQAKPVKMTDSPNRWPYFASDVSKQIALPFRVAENGRRA
jgi:hypothetical protein